MENKTIKGYKVFKPDFTAKDNNFQYAENTEYKHNGPIKICASGFHFCIKAQHCFSYYDFNPENIVCEVEALGKTDMHEQDSKVCTDHIRIGRRLTWAEVLVVANDGANNTGHSNSGNWNSGDRNSGNWNSGYWNSGNWNSGDRNSGNRNSGYWNSGDRNSGNSNSGNWNSGNWNSGDRNSGDSNSGDSNSGDSNSGNRNSGYWNSGDSNSGNWNSGDRNSGNWNSGDRNSGDRNSGNWNSGNWNSGDRNSGDSNSGYRNSGAFCIDNNPFLILFDKPTTIRVREWENHPVHDVMRKLDPTLWIPAYLMSDKEKAANPKYETTDGYLKTISMKDAWKNLWPNLSDDKKKLFTSLPNFDAAKFKEITGIDA